MSDRSYNEFTLEACKKAYQEVSAIPMVPDFRPYESIVFAAASRGAKSAKITPKHVPTYRDRKNRPLEKVFPAIVNHFINKGLAARIFRGSHADGSPLDHVEISGWAEEG